MSTTPAEGSTAPLRAHPCWTDLLRRDPIRTFTGRNRSKADILVYEWGGGEIAVKDYSRRPWLIRQTIGRLLIRREAAAYEAIGEEQGLPRYLGRLGPFALATEFADATPLRDLAGTRIGPEVFDRLQLVVERMHRRGIALADLHHRDVLVADDGKVTLVDLATAYVLGPRPGAFRRRWFHRLRQADLWALSRMRRRYTGAPATVDVDPAAVARHRRWRRVKQVWDRVRRSGRSRRSANKEAEHGRR